MKIFKVLILITITLLGLLCIWQWIDNKDYFKSDYKDLTTEQERIFKWKDNDDINSLKERYRSHFKNNEFTFPRQKVFQVKLFDNKPILGLFTAKTLKENEIDNFVKLCNDSKNFDWGETTWQTSESEYFFRLYNEESKIIGKIYFCLEKCGMTCSEPFCPTMKFGRLSEKGQQEIENFINDKTKWN